MDVNPRLLSQIIIDAERALAYLGPMDNEGECRILGYPVIRHGLESIIKRTKYALENTHNGC